jgi:hypothetical protein
VPEIAQHPLEVHRDEGLILDDENVGGDLSADLLAGLFQQFVDSAFRHLKDLGRLAALELLHGDEQEGLARVQRQGGKRACRGRADLFGLCGGILHSCGECAEEALVEADACRKVREHRGVNHDRFQQPGHRRISRPLTSGEETGEPAQVRQVRGNMLG